MNTGGNEDRFPILDIEWRIVGDIDGDAYGYPEESDVPFSVEDVQKVVASGAKLEETYGDFRQPSRHVQEIHIRTMAHQAQNARDLLGQEPDLGEQIARLQEVGALPDYGGPPPW